jgi:hypothetical protein
MEQLKHSILIFWFLLLKVDVEANSIVDSKDENSQVNRYQVATFKFEHVAYIYTITLWILLSTMAKIGST